MLIIKILIALGVSGVLGYLWARRLMYSEDRQTAKVLRKMQTPYRIRVIKKHFKHHCTEWTEYYNGYADLNAIADYFVKRGHKVTRSPYGEHNPTIYPKKRRNDYIYILRRWVK